MRLFGIPSEPEPKKTVSSQVEKIRNTTVLTEHRIKECHTKAKTAEAEARRYVEMGQTDAARRALAKKKMYMDQANQLSNTSATLNKQLITIESQESTKMVVDCLKEGTDVLGTLNRELDPEDVSVVMEDLEQHINDANEIQESLAKIGGTDLGSSTLDDELAMMVAETRDFPTVPTSKPIPIRGKNETGKNAMEALDAMFSN